MDDIHEESAPFPVLAGIVGLQYPVTFKRKTSIVGRVITFDVGLECSKRGLHMSRIQRKILEVLQERDGTYTTLEEVGRSILEGLGKRFGRVRMLFKLALKRKTPRSGIEYRQVYTVAITVEKYLETYAYRYEVWVPVSTVCPCTGHQQRAVAMVDFESDFEVKVGEIIDLVEMCASGYTRTIVKRDDEQLMVRRARHKRMFVEDFVREVFEKWPEKLVGHVKVGIRSAESIHPHDVFAVVQFVVYKDGEKKPKGVVWYDSM